ncbi:MAG TPA: metallophosphoesterase [Candidatus Faecousia intestinigallinarum]|nr:metallophosphoesterase [Candidatus Faecousia intestinigallinarum]
MKILILSDSHSALSFMRKAVEKLRPDAVVHLGDYYDDGRVIAKEYPGIPVYQVPGNCDRYRCPPGVPEILVESICGVRLFMTHGHRHGVKIELGGLIRDAEECRAQAALFGHTHIPYCAQTSSGMWVLNPGSCGYTPYGAVIETDGKNILACYHFQQADLEEKA